jgi:hypothetical protein
VQIFDQIICLLMKYTGKNRKKSNYLIKKFCSERTKMNCVEARRPTAETRKPIMGRQIPASTKLGVLVTRYAATSRIA